MTTLNRLAAHAAAIVLAFSLAGAGTARAQERDPAAAQALFDQARTLMNAGRYAEACAKLAESLRLDPGLGTQFNLADCQEHEGKLASAWAVFLDVVSLANASGQAARAQAASRRASLLEPRLPRLKVIVPAAARAPGLEITRDGVVVGEAQWELALPLDPGEHRIEVTAPGRKAFAGAVSVVEGGTASFEVPVLEGAPGGALVTAPASEASGAAEASPASSSTSPAPLASPPAAESSSGPSGLVIGLGIAGVVGIGAGSVLGLMASGKNDDSKAECGPDDPNLCSERGVSLRDDALLFGNLSTVGFAVGGAAIVAAAIVWMTEGPAEPTSGDAALALSAGPAGISMEGAF